MVPKWPIAIVLRPRIRLIGEPTTDDERRRVNDTAKDDTNGLISHARSMTAIWGRIFESRADTVHGAATSYLHCVFQ